METYQSASLVSPERCRAMMRRKLIAYLVLATAALAPAEAKDRMADAKADGEAELAKLLAGRTQEAPRQCISTSPTGSGDNARIIEKTALVYGSGKTIYVNRPKGRLDTLQEGDTLVSEVWGSQHCALDRVHTVTPGLSLPHSIMVLGEFVPYSRAAK